MATKNVITTLDIGSTKVCCCIAKSLDDGRFVLMGVGYCACLGVKSGVVIDMGAVEKAIAKAVEDAEKMANYRVKSVYVSISGRNVESKIVRMSLNIGGRTISSEDLVYLLSSCNKGRTDCEIIHSIPILYGVDSLNGIKDPVGMVAHQLSVNMNLVSVPKTQLHNILACLSRCHLESVGVIAAAYASGLYVMDETDMTGNLIVIDFGGGTTSISFFYNGVFCGSAVVPMGGKNITSDVAYGLNISTVNAERLKTLYGASMVSIADEQDMIFAPVIEDDDVISLQQIPKSTLNQIIQPRVDEILQAVKQKIRESVFGEDFARRIVITGGGSLLTGIKDSVETTLRKKIKLKKVNDAIDGTDVQIDNDFSVALGMVKFAQICEGSLISSEDSGKSSLLKKALKWVENNL